MAARLLYSSLPPLRTPLIAVGISLGASAVFQQRLGSMRPLLLDSSFSSTSISNAISNPNNGSGLTKPRLNPRVVRQISMGSILGLVAGIGVSIFSKPLAILLGILIVGVQAAERYGIHVVPYNSIQRYFKGIDIKTSLQQNVPLKISFGILFALTGFAEFSAGV